MKRDSYWPWSIGSFIICVVLICFIWFVTRPTPAIPKPTPKQYPMLTQQQLIDQTLNNMVFVQGGTYMMGTNDKKYMTRDNSPAHKVTLNSFYMSKYLTSGQQLDSYFELTGQKDKILSPTYYDIHGPYPGRQKWAVVNQYCEWLGKVTGLPFSLPTEAQWEYAARDRGQDVPFATNNGKMQMHFFRNYPNPKKLSYYFSTIPVTDLPVNKLGIHQMGGNVSEWMKDWYYPNYYSVSPVNNPQGLIYPDNYNPPVYPATPAEKARGEGDITFVRMKVLRGFALMNYSDGAKRTVREFSNFTTSTDRVQLQDMTSYARDQFIVPETWPGADDAYVNGFRCVINTDQPLTNN